MIDSTTDARVVDFLREVIAKTGVPGICVAIHGHDYRRAFATGIAAADREAALNAQMRFQLGCITKLLTGILVLRFAEEGKLDLDAPAGEYLPDLSLSGQYASTTVRQIASHASGRPAINLADPEAGYYYSWDKFIQFLHHSSPTFSPGTVFNYDHADHVILGRILHRVSNRTFDDLCSEHFFALAGTRCGRMGDGGDGATLNVPDHAFDQGTNAYKRIRSVPYCAFWESSLSQLTLSADQLADVIAKVVFERDAAAKQESPIARRLVERAVALPAMHGGPWAERLPRWFGLGCAEYAEDTFGHNGSARGQTSGIRFDPAFRVAIVVSMNAWHPFARDTVLDTLLKLLRGKEIEAGSRPIGGELPSEIEEWCGRYAGGVAGSDVRVDGANGNLSIEIQSRFSRQSTVMQLNTGSAGDHVSSRDAQHLSVGFFRDPIDDIHGLMIGLNAFKKVA